MADREGVTGDGSVLSGGGPGDVSNGHIFPPWFDNFVKLSGAMTGVLGIYVVVLIYFGWSPKALDAGYMPEQPVPYSHALHAGELGLDCRYCHTGVESSAHASIPPTATCMNCHNMVGTTSILLEPVRTSYQTGLPVDWVRVHSLPDYAYFNHSAHVRRGVGCVECHGRIDQMEEVYQVAPLSMGWCLECHRNPAPRLRPLDKITDMYYQLDSSDAARLAMLKRNELVTSEATEPVDLAEAIDRGWATPRWQGMTSCSTCHR
ncbi:MAG: cytochrome c3 family protein [Planctomycetes bacterium]|nr:cytochrome c3 family protein [Planctomycetota bacterium]